eukprot:2936360-Amphidinium_carterae.1
MGVIVSGNRFVNVLTDERGNVNVGWDGITLGIKLTPKIPPSPTTRVDVKVEWQWWGCQGGRFFGSSAMWRCNRAIALNLPLRAGLGECGVVAPPATPHQQIGGRGLLEVVRGVGWKDGG